MKKQLYNIVLLLSTAHIYPHFDNRIFFNEAQETSKYQYIEKKFITDISTAKDAVWNKVIIGLPAVIAVVAGAAAQSEAKNNAYIKTLLTSNQVYTTVCFGALTIFAGHLLNYHLSMTTNQHAIADFFYNWDKNKFYTPDAFFQAFEIIAQQVEEHGDTFIIQHADEIVETIQFFITRHFEKRYEKSLQLIAYNAINEGKNASILFKNIIGVAKDLSGGNSKD